jgi:hypothetical protein
MIYEMMIKLLGLGILTTLCFHPLTLMTENNTLMLQTSLNKPITTEIKKLVEQGLKFEVVYVMTLKINKQTPVHIEIRKRLAYKESRFYINNDFIPIDQLQHIMGDIDMILKDINLSDNDIVNIVVRGIISENTDFQKATQLKASTLWNYHQPIIKQTYKYDGKNLIKLNES